VIPDHPVHPEMGRFGLFMLFFAVWGSDTFAFFFGKFFGKRVVLPRLSPKKTYMGLLGAIMGAVAGILVGHSMFNPGFLPLGGVVIIGALLGIFGQLGDFFESLLKRGAGIKDSSRIFPGHGGILDRIDSLLLCAPVYYYALLVVSWA